MAFMWRGFSGYVEQLKAHRYSKLLLIVPCLIVLGVGSYSVGRLNASPSNILEQDVGVESVKRFRRDVTQPPNTSGAKTGGTIYTRWGRKECPEGIDMVYTGITGGAWFNHHGGGGNPLCMPMDPLWGTYNEGVAKSSQIYGAEYESPSGFDFGNVGNKSPQDHNIPCAVCLSPAKTSLMIPARNLCYSGWNLEYSGYLMSSHHGHQGKSQFICVDGSPESDPSGFRDENGALFYNVEGVCGSLPCPPYVARREITCAVCSK